MILIRSRSRIARSILYLFLIFFAMASNSWCAQEDYDGLYAGTYSGDDNGVWMIGIDMNLGSFFWSYSTDTNQGDASSFNYLGEIGTIGRYTLPSTFLNAWQIDVEIDSSDGSVTGTWSDTDSDDSGILIATKIISSDYVDQYAGTYKGTYIGDNSGDLVVKIKSNGELYGEITGSVTIDGDDYPFNQEAWLHPDGYFEGEGDGPNDEEFGFWGEINGVNMSGWWYSVTGESGTFTATISDNDGWETIQGTVTYDGTPLCAMVLANGQYMFSCDPYGEYQLSVPLDGNGEITLFVFVDGLAPFKVTSEPSSLPSNIEMQLASPDSKTPTVTSTVVESTDTSGWVKIGGFVTLDGTPLCAMVLANGQYMFSCSGDGSYSLDVPLDNGLITLFVFVDGLQPYKEIIRP